jgi:hypothetical protein
MTALELVKRAWDESGHSENLFDITQRLEDYAMEYTGVRIKSDRVYWFLDKLGLYSTNNVLDILYQIKQEEYSQSLK